MLRSALDALAPPACLVCRTPPPPGDALCRLCRATMPWNDDPCPRCALPRGVLGGCPPCPAPPGAYDAAWAPVVHAGPARDLILALKLRGAVAAADLMAAAMVAHAPPGALGEGTVLVPVPGRPDRRRRRGFDPAERIAAAMARRAGVEVAQCLTRAQAAGRQLGRDRRGRARSVPVALAGGPAPRGTAVLVDDVHTTGATLTACARALRSAGCPRILAVTYVRTLTHA